MFNYLVMAKIDYQCTYMKHKLKIIKLKAWFALYAQSILYRFRKRDFK